jgi:hypothetical protein
MLSFKGVFISGLIVLAAAFLALVADENDALVPATPLNDAEFGQVNDAVRGLAGLGAATDRGHSTWQKSPEWLKYEDWIDGRWSYIQRVRLGAMKAWAGGALGGLRDKPVYYPFSGPDFLYVNAFFPDSKYLLMAGLEPIGTLPDLTQLQQQGRLGAYLQDVKTSLFTILAASFFKTKDMKTDLGNQLVDGLLPDLAVFLGHEGYGIDSLRYVSLGRDGTLRPHGAAGATGVQIAYYRGDRDDRHYLLYFQADLGNDGLSSNPGYIRLMHRLGPGVTYLKAASYLLHDDYFSTMRDAILDNSVGVVEDDSGLPLRDFKPNRWNVAAYGNYTGPLPLFKQYYQPDLAQFYATNSHPALSFGSGYKYIAASSSLLVATKK